MSELAENLAAIRARMQAASQRAGRRVDDIKLIAVSKTFSAAAVREVASLGQSDFGESRWQEAENKIPAVPDQLTWHFIGRIQRNKVRKILPACEVIHAVDSLRLARYMAGVAGDLGIVRRAFLQVNVAGEASKGGFEPESLEPQLEELLELPHLRWTGLMTIPPIGPNPEAARAWFRALRALRDRLEERYGASLPGLSMGMSDDFEVAIEEGATHIRVGSAIFGSRVAPAEDQASM